MPSPLFATKQVEHAVEEGDSSGLRREVGTFDLTALGIGAIIGTGIFVIIGEAIELSGPAIVLSFVLAGITCVFSALSYAELASCIPVSGSAYTYTYATLGEIIAWIIGWDLLLEYGLSVAAIAAGWSEYFNTLMDSLFGFQLPDALASAPAEGGAFNLPAVFIILVIAGVLVAGVRESARANAIMVVVKLAILLVFCGLAFSAFDSGNFDDFAPDGIDGIRSGAAIIFFAYIGFDAVSTASGETKNPGRDLPIAIIGSLVIATILYVIVAIAAVGALSADQLGGSEAPLSTALSEGAGLGWAANLISFGALVAITSVVLTILFGQTRITVTMGRDGLLPPIFGRVSEKRGTPALATILFGLLIALLAAFLPLSELSKLVNIGTLFAFFVVNVGVIILRRTKPDLPRKFRVPLVPVVPVIGCVLCVYLMTTLERETWERFLIWLALGFVVYFAYGRRHSKLRARNAAD